MDDTRGWVKHARPPFTRSRGHANFARERISYLYIQQIPTWRDHTPSLIDHGTDFLVVDVIQDAPLSSEVYPREITPAKAAIALELLSELNIPAPQCPTPPLCLREAPLPRALSRVWPNRITDDVRARWARLLADGAYPDGYLSHGDAHPGNFFADGFVVDLEWFGVRGALYDLAHLWVHTCRQPEIQKQIVANLDVGLARYFWGEVLLVLCREERSRTLPEMVRPIITAHLDTISSDYLGGLA